MTLALTRQFLEAKVIAISGVGGEENVWDAAKLLGARRTFQKPFSMTKLLDAVRYELAHLSQSLFFIPRTPIHDAVIEQHRLAQQQNALVAPGGEGDAQADNVHLGAESFIRLAA